MPDAVRTPEDWVQRFERHLAAGDLEAVLDLYEVDARFVSPSGEVIAGRDAIRAVLARLVQDGVRLKGAVVRSVAVGDVALLYTDWEGPEGRSHAIEVLRWHPERGWRLIVGDPQGRARA